MDTLSYKTVSANKATVNKEWVLVDAEGTIIWLVGERMDERVKVRDATKRILKCVFHET